MPEWSLYHGFQPGTVLPDDPQAPVLDAGAIRRSGLHLGTLAQARMRAGRGPVVAVRLTLDTPARRVRDRDTGWRETVRRAARAGTGALVYLNRHEGLPAARIDAIAGMEAARLARLSDAAFRRLVPEAEDSFLVIDPGAVRVIGRA